MTAARADAFFIALGAWRRAALALAWVAGVALQLQQPGLWPGLAYRSTSAAGLFVWLIGSRLRRRRPGAAFPLTLFAAGVLGFAFTGWRADARLSDALAPEWEGCDIELVGVIDEMPQVAEDGQRFAFAVESARALPMAARDLKRLAALDAAAGRPLTASVAAAVAARAADAAPPRVGPRAGPTGPTPR
ncbi:MAG: DUF4131 domain-containing protein, partial [Burkholderiaceae bacterium]